MTRSNRHDKSTLEESLFLADDQSSAASNQALAQAELPQTLPILPLRGLVVYPQTAVPLNVGQPRSIRLLESTSQQSGLIGLCAGHDRDRAVPSKDEIYRIGTVAAVHRQLRRKDGTIRMLVNGLNRFRIKSFISTEPFLVAEIEPLPEDESINTQTEAMARNLVDMFMRLAEFVPSIPGDLLISSLKVEHPLQLVYTIGTYLQLDLNDAQQFLEFNSAAEKLAWLVRYIGKETEIMEMGQRIRSEAFGQMEQAQREYFLREQLKAIQRELGEADEREVEARTFQAKIEAAAMPLEARQEAERELKRLTKLPVAAAEYGVVRTYLEWLVNLPWNISSTDNLDLGHARTVLDEDHHGLEEVKERIVEFLAVRRLREERPVETAVSSYRPDRLGAILCFLGPPGVGKTSLGRSIARAMGREFARISLGGMRDEAEIRGHRRTYIGALPGRIIQVLRRCKSKNPVIILDEIDKLGADFRGDPAAALLEVLDPEQNCDFTDHYLDVSFDLSAIIFITTANTLDSIPRPLQDRMEVIRLAGYTEREKVAIAQNYLVPRQIRENGLLPEEVQLDTAVLSQIIRDYTREAGVRELERQIGRVCRKVATAVAQEPFATSALHRQIVAETLTSYLGPVRFQADAVQRTSIPGVATGLAWTSTGGHILFIEAAKMPGQKGLTITGQLGNVMQESAQAALTYVRAKANLLGVASDFFEKHDIHIHIPAGAIPKDGPSAGITIATALASLLTKRPVCNEVGMTGEITLRGQVMPVGGIKEKVLAAHRAGLHILVLPEQNEPDLAELPNEIKEELSFILVSTMDEVLKAALCTD
ncbi:MAG: endopeptidase La [Ardenticatenaceae bacterium]|nr:endopeptidase La [Ardenticatenaceae bacterium]MCB8947397.1 endopeptidase La [Ardenticatenaceae bacterium]